MIVYIETMSLDTRLNQMFWSNVRQRLFITPSFTTPSKTVAIMSDCPNPPTQKLCSSNTGEAPQLEAAPNDMTKIAKVAVRRKKVVTKNAGIKRKTVGFEYGQSSLLEASFLESYKLKSSIYIQVCKWNCSLVIVVYTSRPTISFPFVVVQQVEQ